MAITKKKSTVKKKPVAKKIAPKKKTTTKPLNKSESAKKGWVTRRKNSKK